MEFQYPRRHSLVLSRFCLQGRGASRQSGMGLLFCQILLVALRYFLGTLASIRSPS